MKSTRLFLLGISLITFSFYACKKENTLTENDVESLSAQRQMEFVQAEMENVEEIADNEMPSDGPNGERPDSFPDSPCATRVWTGDSIQRILTIDYGINPCLCIDSVYRSGKIKIVFNGKKHVIGSTKIVNFIDYNVNAHLLNGTIESVYKGNAVFNRKIVEMNMQFEGRISNWKGEEMIKILAGFETPTKRDNIKSVVGKTWGKNLNGVNYERKIIKPLIRKNDCSSFFINGTIRTENERGNTILLDFNPFQDEACDNLATISINNNEPQLITLSHRIR